MRIVITGIDDQGRSCVVEETEVHSLSGPSDEFKVTVAGQTVSSPPPPRPPGRGEHRRVTRGPGLAVWAFVDFPPMSTTEMHHSDSVDFSIVLEGTVDLILDDGTHRLGPGDGVMMNGVDHAWATHEEGCRTSVVVIGTSPPQ
jgi:quercetin dioxygenase-like cupin family protein